VSAESNSEIDNASEYSGDQDTGREIRDDLSEEVSTDRVHVVVDFSEEDRSFIREDKDDILDRVE